MCTYPQVRFLKSARIHALEQEPLFMENETPITTSSKMSKFKNILLVVFFAGTIGSSAGAYYFHDQLSELKENPAAAAQNEAAELLEKVGRLIDLPTDEQPTIATVSDPEKLKEQAFFVKAKEGFKVIVYTKAKKAILYDPVADKIIEVAPVNVGEDTVKTGAAADTTKTGTTKPATTTNGDEASDEDNE